MKKWLSAICLLLVAITACASSDSSSLVTSLTNGVDSITNHTDLAMNYLSQLLGTVGGNVLPAGDANIFGTLMMKFNSGILVAMFIFITATVFTHGIDLALSAERLHGKNLYAYTQNLISSRMFVSYCNRLYSATTDDG